MNEQQELEREVFALSLGLSMDNRKTPRIRGVLGRPGMFAILAQRLTRRAAFRRARELRAAGEDRPLVVYGSGRSWTVGSRYVKS